MKIHTKSKILIQFAALILIFNASILLAAPTAIPEDEEETIELLVVDEEFINLGLQLPDDDGTKPFDVISQPPINCGGGDAAACINENESDLVHRGILFTNFNDITDDVPPVQITVTTGFPSDAGIFKFFKDDPQLSDQNGAEFTRCEFITATGDASDENNLSKMINLKPLTEAQIYDLINKSAYCAVVQQSDISDVGPADGSFGFPGEPTADVLGKSLGVTAFKVVDVQPHPFGGDHLPIVTFELLPSNQIDKICERSCVPMQLNKH